MCGYKDQSYLPFLYAVSQKMIPHFYVLGFRMEHWVLCNTYDTGAVTLKWDMGILLTKVTHVVCDPKELRATTSCGNVLCLGSGLSNIRLTSRDVVNNDVPLTSPKAPKWSQVVICDDFVTIFIWSQNWCHICASVTKCVFCHRRVSNPWRNSCHHGNEFNLWRTPLVMDITPLSS
jgi:hypothetical protein